MRTSRSGFIARDREVAVRTALGSSRWRIVRHLLVESVVLAAAGALLGIGLAVWGVRVLTTMVPVQLPIWMQVRVDGRVMLFLIGVTLVTGIIAGLVPALRSGSRDLQAALKEGAHGSSTGASHRRLRNGLVVAEVALAFVLLAGAALLLQTIVALQRVPLGFETANTLTFRVELGWAGRRTAPPIRPRPSTGRCCTRCAACRVSRL
jgi:putative ABC transport system permease protein